MSSKAPAAVAFFLAFTVLIIVAAPITSVSHAASSSTRSGYIIKNIETFNAYGQFSVNETLLESTNASSGLSSFTLGFPSAYQGHMADMSLHAESANSSIQVSASPGTSTNGTYSVTFSLSPALQAGVNSSVSIGFYVLNTFAPVSNSNYTVPILFSPAVSIPVDQLQSHVIFPYLTTNVANPTPMQRGGFSETVNGTTQTWDYEGSNVSNTVRSADVLVYSDPSSSGAIDFTSIQRQISIDSSGQVMVKDTLDIKNLGENTIYTLNYSPLTNSSSLTAVPSAQPPLSNEQSIPFSGGQLSLNSTEQAIQPDSAVSLIYQYPLAQQYWNSSNGVYTISIPTSAPVSAIVDSYRITLSTVSGVVVSTSQLPLTGFNTTTLGTSAKIAYRIGIASAFGDAIPIAAILFIAVFVGAVLFRPRPEAKEDTSSIFDSLIKAVEDKVSSTNEVLGELKSKGSSISRNDLVVARSRIDDFRVRTSQRIGSVRAQLAGSTVSVQTDMNDVMASDREFDRVVRDILNNYDQFVTRKMKEETFQRLQQSNDRRLQGVANSLLDKVHDLTEEYESES